MPITREPKPLPSPLDYVPPQSAPYKVVNDDTWWTLAERPEMRSARMSASDLCHFNFRTRTPSEINWYLQHKVGCRLVTRDRDNFRFSSADRPGIVYLPRVGVQLPPHEQAPASPARTQAWFGLGARAGTQFTVVGIETLTGYVASLDDPGKGMAIAASINRVGPGWGVTGSVCFIYATGISGPEALHDFQQGDWDFNLSLGGNWGKMAKGAEKVRRLQPLIDVVRRMGATTPATLKKLLQAHPDQWIDLIRTGGTVKDFVKIDPDGDPNVFVFDVPFAGGGVEASIFYGVANFSAVWDGP